MQDIANLISNSIKEVNDKILGYNFLERLKYILIDHIKSYDLLKIDNIVNKEHIIEIENFKIFIKIEKKNQGFSMIKTKTNLDNLTIILEGNKKITIHQNSNSKSFNQLHLSKHTGLVLLKNTIIDELIAKETILLNVAIISNNHNTEV